MIVKLEAGTIDISIINASTLRITHSLPDVKIIINDRKIIEQIIFQENYRIVLGESLEVNKDGLIRNYFIGHITKEDDFEYTIKSTIKNKSSIFLIPLISNSKDRDDYMNYNSYLFNSYVKFNGYDSYNNGKYLFLKYRFFNTEFYYDLEKRLMELPTFVKTIQPDKEFSVYIFKIPDQFQKDVKLIMNGKYSSISATAKSKIILFHKFKITDKIAMILNNSRELRDQLSEYYDYKIPIEIDLLSKPKLEEETLT